ncbi:hypothetical protein Cylst_2999 [Cylindrospermum stagnale PCC 7417]|uniref:Uncharacterized protein n=1 Tax=Cylindrospermum stagnale PCC 7417 TaxID=56107 RepID=K9WXT3_9NOST|nr:hypothetical protein [Cylindrospermum stagnale]AFZ25170.1 hypothetical protein Cylst_2999 [Cylindrospermum stagnale PCC 7417]
MYMIYSNLLDNLPAITGLFFAGVWLIYKSMLIAYKLDIFKETSAWFNQKPIIMPSLIFILSPFISTFTFQNFSKNSDEFIKAFTPITCIAAYIAYQQYQINRQQLRKNLSDKRLQIYVSAMTLVASGRKDSPEIIQEKLNAFEIHLYEAQFLFSKDVNEKLKEIYAKNYDLITLKINIKDEENYAEDQSTIDGWYESSNKQESTKRLKDDMAKRKIIREYLADEMPKIKSLFDPYIDLSNIAIEQDIK